MVAPHQAEITQAVEVLTRDFGASEVWLFGSAATGASTEHSDIDLLVVRRPFDLLVLTPERWREARQRPVGVYEEIVQHGIKLHEG